MHLIPLHRVRLKSTTSGTFFVLGLCSSL
ncbi:BnaC05g32710D [Brassica napus]|nr:BnaC05g32710D [Brassica napus]